MKKTIFFIALITLCGCSFKAGDELLQAPKVSKDYMALQSELDNELSNGSVFTTPLSGTNRNNVQLIDIDGDSEEEVVAFFRTSTVSGEFNVVIYSKMLEDYEEIGRVSGIGNNIDIVDYPVFSHFGGGGIAVSWMISNEIERGLTIGYIESDKVYTVLDTTYISYLIYDIDGDSIEEIFTINRSQDRYILNLYRLQGYQMILDSSINLSIEVDTILRMTTGELQSGLRAIAIDSIAKNTTGIVTDLITLNENGKFENLTIDKETESSMATYRAINMYTTKLFNTNLLYVPTITPMLGFDEMNLTTMSYVTTWSLYDYYNETESNLYTYHNNAEGWYYKLDNYNKDKIIINRDNFSNIRATTFAYYINPTYSEKLFTIYTIPLSEYNTEQFGDEYIILGGNSTSVYVAKNLVEENIGISNAEIISNFKIISN